MTSEKTSKKSTDTVLPPHPIMVVLVDDQPMIAESIRRMLEDEPDIDLHYCMEASQALDTVNRIQPTLILQDLIMPHTNGLDLVRQYREHLRNKEIPIIVLSAREESKVKAEAFACGANDYVVKLPDKPELVARIRYHSQWYIHKLQRDDAYRSLQESQRQLEALNLSLYKMSSLDGLTGIMNRGRFNERLEDEWQRAKREKQALALIMIDIDFFKLYNDNLGHLAGDECLKKVATILSESLKRPADNVARYGGEEFVALLPNTEANGVMLVAEEMRRMIEVVNLRHPDSTVSDHVTISLGAAVAKPSGKCQSDTLLQAADDAMYQSKEAGRNRTTLHHGAYSCSANGGQE